MKLVVLALCIFGAHAAALRQAQTASAVLQAHAGVAGAHVTYGLKRAGASMCRSTALAVGDETGDGVDAVGAEVGARLGKILGGSLLQHEGFAAKAAEVGAEVGEQKATAVGTRCAAEHKDELRKKETRLLAIVVNAYAEELGRKAASKKDAEEEDSYWKSFGRAVGERLGNEFGSNPGSTVEDLEKKSDHFAHLASSYVSQNEAAKLAQKLAEDLPEKLKEKVNEELGLPAGTDNGIF